MPAPIGRVQRERRPVARRPATRSAITRPGVTRSAVTRPRSRVAETPPSGRLARVIAFAVAQVGDAYVWGADGPDAWDCSGLVAAAYARIGVHLPHQSGAIRRHRRVRTIPRSAMRPGDLVWPHEGHVGIYLGGGRIVHAATPEHGVRIGPLYAFMAAARVT